MDSISYIFVLQAILLDTSILKTLKLKSFQTISTIQKI